MMLEGSCLCGAVTFSVEAYAPVPYLRCYCSICRKSAGDGGFAINLGAWAKSLKVEGEEHITVFHAVSDGNPGSTQRRFCSKCGSALWCWNPDWPDLIHPFAGAVDTELPVPAQHSHMLLGSRAGWVPVDTKPGDELFDQYPDRSLEEWHKEHYGDE